MPGRHSAADSYAAVPAALGQGGLSSMPLNAFASQGLVLRDVVVEGQWFFGDGPRIQSCCTEPEQCRAGDLFVMLDEHRMVTHEEIEAAIDNGAVAILAERPVPNSVPQFVVPDARSALGRLCHALASTPCRSLRTLGIAGTFGKSTTARLLMSILKVAGQSARSMDTQLLGDHGALRLARWLADSRAEGAMNAVLECASQSLARKQLDGTQLDTAVITNVRREHATWHGTLRNYQRAVTSVLDYVKPDGFVVANADDPVCREVLKTLDLPTLTIGLHRPAEISATVVERHVSEQTFLLDAGDDSVVVRTKIIGDGHIYNCMTAAAICLVMGVDPTLVVKGLESMESFEGRLQRLECGQPFGVFVDASHTPSALGNALDTLRSVCSGSVHCVFGVDHRLSGCDRAKIGRALELYADESVLTSARLDRKMSLRNAHDVLDGFDRPAQGHLMPDRAQAICWALSQAQPGDAVLLAGAASPGKAGDDAEPIEDRDVAEYWLRHVRDPSECPWTPV